MSIAVVGINHRTVPLDELEPLIVAPSQLPKALADLSSRPHLDEVVVVSTCMRTEVYALVNRFHGAMADIREFLAAWSGKAPEEFAGNLYSYFDDGAVSHLFRVASGLGSASLGEPEVLGQVRRAAEVARREGASGPALATVFRHAVEVGKRARTETGIGRGVTSLSHAAVQLAAEVLGGLEGKQALVLGAGEVGQSAARAFAQAAPGSRVLISNRGPARAEALASAVEGRAVPWAGLEDALAGVDVVASATAGEVAIFAAAVTEAGLDRRGRPLLIIDLGVPRTVEPSIASVPGVTVLDMDDISEYVAGKMSERQAEVPAVERIIAEETARYAASVAERSVAPLISATYDRAEKVRQSELTRFVGRSRTFTDEEIQAVELMTKRLVAKLLHDPTVRVKEAAGTARGEALAEALRDLFDLQA